MSKKLNMKSQLIGHDGGSRGVKDISPNPTIRQATNPVRLVLLALAWVVLPAGAAQMQTVSGHVPAAVKSLTPMGRMPPGTQLNLAIGLPLRNAPALSNLLHQIYDSANPKYHHYLTPAQFTEKFGPTELDYQALIAYAAANHLQVTATHPNRMLLDVRGKVADMEQAFHVTLRTYQHPTENRTFYAPDTEPSLSLSVPVLHISGLDNLILPHPLSHRATSLNATPAAGSGPNGYYLGNDFRTAYAPGVSLTGAGQSVGLLQFESGFYQTDIAAYEALAGLPAVPVQAVLLDGYDGGPGTKYDGGNTEVSLDIEMVISMAPGVSHVYVFEGSVTDDILNSMAASNQVQQLSASWSYPFDATTEQIFQQFGAQGQSFFNASGDGNAWGTYSGPIPTPLDDPYLTIVGGTTLTMNGNGSAYNSETVWNAGLNGSGGGISATYSIPSWQTNINMTACGGSTTMRNIPDVALTADNVWVIWGNGSAGAESGTSCATPLWAGFAALCNQNAANEGQQPIGFINPTIYAIATGPNYNACFHDITNGNNNLYYAVPGYDLCTGLGTPTGQNLINAVGNPDSLAIRPALGFNASGRVGGPFFPTTSQAYSLTNLRTSTLTWTLSNTSAWLTASSTTGTLTAGGPAATVTISLNNAASNLVVGTYNSTIWITNQNDNIGQSRLCTLSVISPPSITLQPTNQAVLEGALGEISVQATGGLPLVYQWQFNGTNLADGGNIFGSATASLMISNVSPANVGSYTVVVTNFAGVATSSNASLAITPSPPVIAAQPASQAIFAGLTAQLNVDAIGSWPLSFQWNFNGTNILNATNPVLTLTGVQLTNGGNYSVLVTNALGAVQSSNAILTVLACDPAPSGIVSWWAGEGNALDNVGINNGVLEGGLGFAPGEVGQAFFFNNADEDVKILASQSLDVGAGSGFTLEAWVNCFNVVSLNPIFEWNLGDGKTQWGLHFYIGAGGPGSLYANVVDSGGKWHSFSSAQGIVASNVFQHAALTYDRTTGTATIYCNGAIVAQSKLGSFTPQTSYSLYLGSRPGPGANLTFAGLIDEPSVYNRALSSNEIATIYQAGSDGKCPIAEPPMIFVQPTNQMVQVNGTVAFTVVAGGPPPLAYQWSFNGTNLVNATNTTLILTNLQLNQTGNYSVLVTNHYSSTNSAIAVLNVYALPPFITLEPANQTVFLGGTTTFSVAANGTPPLNYQWSFQGTNLANATNTTLTLTDAQLNQTGNYSVLVTNLYGSTNSVAALLTVIPCDPAPSGIVSWWAGEGNALDGAGTNNGVLESGLGFAPGEVGQAFLFNTTNEDVKIPASQSLDVGAGNGFTLEAWVNCSNVVSLNPIFEWNLADGTTQWGVHFYIGAGGPGSLYANVVNNEGGWETLSSAQGIVASNVFQHVALTYDETTGTATIYRNGTNVARSYLGSFTPQTSYSLYLGRRPGPDANLTFAGLIDEPSIYNRALSSNEITAIYLAGGNGKCPLAPTIYSQPTNQSVNGGGTASFNVLAGGTPTLTYQWSFNGTNLFNATNATLTLAGVQLTNSGNFAVSIANAAGSTNSANASLTVIDNLDHFAWISIPSPRFVNAPFGVSIQALDAINQVFTNFTGTAILTATGVPVNPRYADGFIQGAWTGSLTIAQTVSNLVLQASDGAGHAGLANPINVVATPSLATARTGGTLVISWPIDPVGFSLEFSTNLVLPQWAPVGTPPVLIGNQYWESVQIGSTNLFYRLRYTLP